jgi:uncharacterized membrane protein
MAIYHNCYRNLPAYEEKMRNHSRMFVGVLLIVIGAVFFLKMIGVLNFSIWSGFRYYWPVGLILVGVALILRMKWLALLFLFLTILFWVLYLGSSSEEYRTVTKYVPADDITTADLKVSYGAGDLSITDGSSENLIKHTAKTADLNDPEINVKKTGDNAEINIERKSASLRFWNVKDEWELEISPDVIVNLDLNYGAADAKINLENLKVDNLAIDTGATSTEITFGSYPIKADIHTGASSISLKFPEDAGVMIEVDGGAISTKLDGFTKEDGKYFSENYEPGDIEVKIDAGASSIEGSFY